MRTISLSNGTLVEIVEKITWGIQEELRAIILGGVKATGLASKDNQSMELDMTVTLKAKYKALELCVKKITDSNGKIVQYSKEWMDNLSVEDGDVLFNAVNELTTPSKK